MSQILEKLREGTRWDKIPDNKGYRLSCSNSQCSHSCANLRGGRLSVTSVHGTERHSYIFTKRDTALAMLSFLDTLPKADLENFCKIFNKMSEEFVLNVEKLET